MQTYNITKNKKYRIKSLYDNTMSHNQMATFFSGTDTQTLREEGNERNCFVSLIVNNAGTYCAAVTRKIQTKNEVTIKSLGSSYEFFGEGPVTTGEDPKSETTSVVEKEIIQYFMLDIEKEEVTNPLECLDIRFDEIQKKKESNKPFISHSISDGIDMDEDFSDWMHKKNTSKVEQPEVKVKNTPKELTVYDDEIMKELEIPMYSPDPAKIHSMVTKLVMCSLIIDPKKVDLKQWIARHMKKKYDELFTQDMSFDYWCDFAVEYLFQEYSDPEAPAEFYLATDELHAILAEAMIDELGEYPYNGYIELYINVLNRYLEV